MTEMTIGVPRFRGRVRRPEVLVIGGGLSGMTAALAARRTGAEVALVAEGAGVLELASGCIDRLAVPFEALPPAHPYRLLGMAVVEDEIAEFRAEMARVGWPLSPGEHEVITALGARRPTHLVGPGMAAPPPGEPVWVVGFRGLRDFDPAVVAAGMGGVPWSWVDLPGNPEEVHPVALARQLENEAYREEVIDAVLSARDAAGLSIGASGLATGASGVETVAPGLATGASGLAAGASGLAAGASGPAAGASGLTTGAAGLSIGASGLATGASGQGAAGSSHGRRWVLFPAVLGLAGAVKVQEDFAAATGMCVAEVLLPPPSVPGLRLAEALRRAVQQAGVDLALGARAVRAEVENGRVRAVVCEGPGGQVTYEAEAYVLATGGLLGGGIAAEGLEVREPLFGLRVATPGSSGQAPARRDSSGEDAPRQEQGSTRQAAAPRDPSCWADADFLPAGGHPFVRVGVPVDEELRPEGLANLFVCGRTLAGYAPYAEGCGGGVAVATGGAAGRLAGCLALSDGGERR
ncbi:anaerobic glycerol-3-phosphate dehydrogenase subunit B [Symbiobacterium terraclitae]|uniref:anaerobic glycerol-3-phosphate dehydrogenase subunit B n=1 Tax=Symbiobacterium terraclitae TaxID=557451 RepID=UPI0035B566C8